MVILDEDPVPEAVAVVFPPAYLYGVFFEDAQVGTCFAGVHYDRTRASGAYCELMRVGGDPREQRKKVDGDAFGRKDPARRAFYPGDNLPLTQELSVFFKRDKVNGTVDLVERLLGDTDPAQDAFFLGDNVRTDLF